jgi:hypothetical protein
MASGGMTLSKISLHRHMCSCALNTGRRHSHAMSKPVHTSPGPKLTSSFPSSFDALHFQQRQRRSSSLTVHMFEKFFEDDACFQKRGARLAVTGDRGLIDAFGAKRSADNYLGRGKFRFTSFLTVMRGCCGRSVRHNSHGGGRGNAPLEKEGSDSCELHSLNGHENSIAALVAEFTTRGRPTVLVGKERERVARHLGTHAVLRGVA